METKSLNADASSDKETSYQKGIRLLIEAAHITAEMDYTNGYSPVDTFTKRAHAYSRLCGHITNHVVGILDSSVISHEHDRSDRSSLSSNRSFGVEHLISPGTAVQLRTDPTTQGVVTFVHLNTQDSSKPPSYLVVWQVEKGEPATGLVVAVCGREQLYRRFQP